MKQRQVAEWESQWTSQRRRDQIATEIAALEQERHHAGWRRNYVFFAGLVIAIMATLVLSFS